MTSNFRESALPDAVQEIGESTEPHALGAYFRVDSTILEKIEEDHREDTRRQMGEVIKYLLLNSLDPELSWKSITQAAQKIESGGGHPHLTTTLSEKYRGELAADSQRIIALTEGDKRERKSTKESSVVLLDSTVKRKILILGKNGEGKSTLGNRMLKSCHFKINSTDMPRTCTGVLAVKSQSQLKDYKLKFYDHDGLFDTEISTAMSSLFAAKAELQFNIVLFVMKRGHYFDTYGHRTLDTIMKEWPDISGISALVITHCERLSDGERKVVVQEVKEAHPAVINFMKLGIITVGFPDQHYVRGEESLVDVTERDATKLRTLIYFSNRRVKINRLKQLEVPSETNVHIAEGTSEAKPVISCRDTKRPDQPSQSPPPAPAQGIVIPYHSPPQASVWAPKQLEVRQNHDDYQPSKPRLVEMTEAKATKSTYLAGPVCESKSPIDGNKKPRKGLKQRITSKISNLMKKFEKSSDPDQSSRSENGGLKYTPTHENVRLELEDSDGGKPRFPPKPSALAYYTPRLKNKSSEKKFLPSSSNSNPQFGRVPSPKSVIAEPPPPSTGRSQKKEPLMPVERQPRYKRSPNLGRRFPPAGLTSPKSEKIKQDQSEAKHASVIRTNTLPRNFERLDSLESSPLSRRKFSRGKSVRDLKKLFEEKSRNAGHGCGSNYARAPGKWTSPLRNKSTFTSRAANEFDQFEVKHHLLGRIEWKKSSTSDRVFEVTIYDTAEGKWCKIAEYLGLNPNKVKSIRRDCHDDHERVTEVFFEWLNNANQLPNSRKYPKKWSGLIRLLKDSELGELAEDLWSALNAPLNSIKDNLSPSAIS